MSYRHKNPLIAGFVGSGKGEKQKTMATTFDINDTTLNDITTHLEVLSTYDRHEAKTALKLILSYSKESATTLADVHELLQNVIEEI